MVDEEGKKRVFKTIVHMGSTSPTDAQSRFSAMELEMLCVQWACHRLNYFLLGAPEINLHTDSSGVCTVMKQHISDITNPCLARMCGIMLPYIVVPFHIKGCKNSIAN